MQLFCYDFEIGPIWLSLNPKVPFMKKLILSLFVALMLIMPQLAYAERESVPQRETYNAEKLSYSTASVTIGREPSGAPSIKSIIFFDAKGKRVGYATVGKSRNLTVVHLLDQLQGYVPMVTENKIKKNGRSSMVIYADHLDVFMIKEPTGRVIQSWSPNPTIVSTIKVNNFVTDGSLYDKLKLLATAFTHMDSLKFSKR